MIKQEDKSNSLHLNLKQKPEVKKEKQYIKPLQSANVLFKFMPKIDYLKDILKKLAILPRYYEEDIQYLEIDGLDKIAFPMSCFCDIHLNKLKYHIDKYGSYGIGLSKEWGIKQGIQPIQYINVNSNLRKDFSAIFSNSIRKNFEVEGKLQEYNNYLLHDLFYMKPLEGEMLISNSKRERRNFHDEKEWRYIPDFRKSNTELPLVIKQTLMNPKSYNTHSQAIEQCPELWLKIKLENIKHLIISEEQERKELIDFIIENQIGDTTDQYILFSKIIVFNELEEDW